MQDRSLLRVLHSLSSDYGGWTKYMNMPEAVQRRLTAKQAGHMNDFGQTVNSNGRKGKFIIVRLWRLDETHEYAGSRATATDCEAGRAYE